MKYLVTESQVNSLINVYTNFLNSETYEGVCDVMVDYDEVMDKFVLNIFFDREFIIPLGEGQTRFINKKVRSIAGKFYHFTGKVPMWYNHFKNC